MDKKSEYIILYEELRQHIRNGEIPPGNKLPSERAFMETYHLSRTTVRSALALLEREKYVVKQPGVGCIVLSSSEKEKSEKLRIGISLSTVSDQTYQTLLYEELMRAGERSNIDFIVRKNSELILGEGIDGAIFTTVTVSELKQMENDYRRKCPVVFINRMPVHPQFAYFAVDYENTSRRLVSRLLKNGAERVAMIGGADYLAGKYFADYTRSQGWRAAYREYAGHVPEELLFRTEELYADLNLACRRIEKEQPQVLFVSCSSLLSLLSVILKQLNITVGKDVSVVCFDNVERIAESMRIPISYIRMPFAEMVGRSVDYIVKALRENAPVPKELIDAQLVVNNCHYLF